MTHYHQAAVFTPKVVARASFGQIQEQHWSAKPATFMYMYIYIYISDMHACTHIRVAAFNSSNDHTKGHVFFILYRQSKGRQ